jgi:hypothetical protein
MCTHMKRHHPRMDVSGKARPKSTTAASAATTSTGATGATGQLLSPDPGLIS